MPLVPGVAAYRYPWALLEGGLRSMRVGEAEILLVCCARLVLRVVVGENGDCDRIWESLGSLARPVGGRKCTYVASQPPVRA